MPMILYKSKVGTIGVVEKDGGIKRIYITDDMPENEEICETPLLKEAVRQLDSYFAGELKEFTLPLSPEGTEFMKRVWAALCDIPYGKTATYKDIAEKIGSPKAARAVGLANNRNPIPIIIPCHRVIGADGSLTGYAGGLDMKQKLLDLEKR